MDKTWAVVISWAMSVAAADVSPYGGDVPLKKKNMVETFPPSGKEK
jgi:hypothetical protein